MRGHAASLPVTTDAGRTDRNQLLGNEPAVEGLEDRAIPPTRAIADFRALRPEAPVVERHGVGHFCQEDAPQVLVPNLHQLIQPNP